MPTEGHDPGKAEGVDAPLAPKHESRNLGYEPEDVNVGGVLTFLAGLTGFITIFFFFCFAMGKAINYALIKHDGAPNKWHTPIMRGLPSHAFEGMRSSTAMQQQELAQMVKAFPTPRLATDNGDQAVADLHAREDLLLNYYSTSPDLPPGTIRIPIDRAMQLIIERGLPKAPQPVQSGPLMAGETEPTVTAPLTDGFARTGYELQTIAAREEQNEFDHAEGREVADENR